MKRAIDEKWTELVRTRPVPNIFWGFIEYERNRFLKNYEHGISRTLTIPGPDLDGKRTVLVVDCANSRGGRGESPDATFDSCISDGLYAGRHERAVAFEAHDWWKEYLDDVDALAESYRAV